MYNLHLLGWRSFQDLCNCITREILGQTALSYLPSNDQGRDGSFTGKWITQKNEVFEGEFVIQCKFTSKQNKNFTFSDFSYEIEKVKELVKQEICDIYIIMTNAGISAKSAAKVKSELEKLGVKHSLVFGNEYISQQIKENTKLRRMVPRVYGLGDLSQIIDERVYRQAQVFLESLKDELAKVVITKSYHKAVEALEEYNFVLIVGEPAAGKTTIATLLAMGALDQWQAATLKLHRAEDVVKHWNPDEPNQLFWIDDAFGATHYESPLVYSWNSVMPQIVTMISRGAKIIMTSRDYIYNAAKKDLKSNVFPLLNESQVVVDVHDLSIEEKRQMLYNHIKLGKQSKTFRKEIKPFLESVAQNKRFIPETARRLSDPYFTSKLHLTNYWIDDFVERQEGFLIDVISDLDKDSKAALALIYMNNSNLLSPISLSQLENESLSRMGSSLNKCIEALNAMSGSMVHVQIEDDQHIWKYKHPTIGDAFARYLVKNTELLEIYIKGSDTDKLLDQITCGNVKLQGATIIPQNLFPSVLNKLTDYTKTKKFKTESWAIYFAKWGLVSFLSRRCSPNFLKMYVKQFPAIYEDISQPDLSKNVPREIELAVIFVKNGLLPEKNRLLITKQIAKYALTGENLDFLESEEIQSLFHDNELLELKDRIKNELLVLPLSEMTKLWKSKYRENNEDAEYHMYSLKSNLSLLQEYYPDVPDLETLIEDEIENIDDWIVNNTIPEEINESKTPMKDEKVHESDQETRSIFEDIDS
ncbi:MAG: hypothetical protein J0G96_09875 [Flavobacteriia bacterium]|uniref:nSTAND3 domain-containing NTPase n=1 Tax=uncultured Flavobacterium sp. TaxID=165435 RepID=UPI00095AF4C3|nr:hypothetical protein [uncultured Flavobacterium sp.]MBN9294275.1 hypothetical protein [Flavobacteriia bacterium]OJX36608.1 MAG: hypothetical protein BGO87_12465 [Flavobacteriia bacterium 40-80]